MVDSLKEMFFYLVMMGVTALTIRSLKIVFGRDRPSLVNSNRIFNLRKREVEKAFPSGDTTHATLFSFFLLFHFGNPYWTIIVPCVAFARVFYQCHWFGDTLGGACAGLIMASFSYLLRMLPSHMMSY